MIEERVGHLDEEGSSQPLRRKMRGMEELGLLSNTPFSRKFLYRNKATICKTNGPRKVYGSHMLRLKIFTPNI